MRPRAAAQEWDDDGEDVEPFAGRWVAVADGEVMATDHDAWSLLATVEALDVPAERVAIQFVARSAPSVTS